MSQPPPTQAGQGQACDERPVEDPEGALLLRFAQGDPHVAAELTQRLAPRALGVAMRVLGNRAEAEDITQEAMVRLWRQAEHWEPGRARVFGLVEPMPEAGHIHAVVALPLIDRLCRRLIGARPGSHLLHHRC
ncbi:MAG: sigma factor, partial [Pseudomonadota bacterium]|nr:sigma factor [Pseudomonadota bacterium]